MTEEKEVKNRKKTLSGVVVSDSGDKTAVVKSEFKVMDKRYKKYVKKSRKFHVHDEKNELKEGDFVTIIETRPVSKLKRWRVLPEKS
jgi:small subunit ribosomal protein S17